MNSSDRDLTLRALDRLPPAEARELDQWLADDPAAAASLRSLEDTITAVWLASSPLQPAPTNAFEGIRAQLHPARRRPSLFPALAALGWAAAIVLWVVRFARPDELSQIARGTPVVIPSSPADSPASPAALSESPAVDNPAEAQLRETIRRLQSSLAIARSRVSAPRIRELRAPGSAADPRADDHGSALLELLKTTLSETLARRTEIPTTLTIESGWLESTFAGLPADSVIRHRSFPEEYFADYGLLRSIDGEFYDPVAGLLWSPAPDGRGYLGRAAPAELDPSRFETHPAAPATPHPPGLAPSPSGYLVQGGPDEESTLVIGNLPPEEPPAQLVASIDGGITTFPLTSTSYWPGADGSGFGTFSLPTSLGGDRAGSPLEGSLTIFQVHPNGTWTTLLTESP
jgi:hypothetical protein